MVAGCRQGKENIFVILLLLMVDVETYSSTLEDGRNNRTKREDINKDKHDNLTRFGYLPQSDLETGALRTMQV